MKNKELLYTKLRKTILLVVQIIGSYLLLIVLWAVLIDGLLEDFLANAAFDIQPTLYSWLVSNKSIIFMMVIILIMGIVLYCYISKEIDQKEEIYQAIEKILADNEEKIELPESEIRFSKKLNEVKYDYILNKKKALEEEQKRNDLIVYMAHDLKTPLTSVIGYLTLIHDEKEHLSQDIENKYINIALEKAKRVEELTNQFFEITRFNLYNMELTKKQINITILLEQLIEECYPMLKDKQLSCCFHKTTSLSIMGDGDKLARAFENLLKNAINYSYEKTTIEIELSQQQNHVIIIFKNQCEKIPQYKLDKIFDKFYRGDASRHSSTGGSGLGLAITKEIIELHQGTISVKNDDEYMTFTIELPQ